ncbi:MAG TPA: hypothetical protein VKV95_04400 [Terriglobia bacterium]|nr:hypothetical protein [Terriglobia bacterium]
MIRVFRQFLSPLCSRHSAAVGNVNRRNSRRRGDALATCFILVGVATGLAYANASSAHTTLPPVVAVGSNSQESTTPDVGPSPPLAVTPKQRRAILKSNFEKIKKDTDELAALAKSLQDEIGKSNENVLSLKVVEDADKIEKLAKRIKSMARGE